MNPKVQVLLSRDASRLAVLEVEVAGNLPIKSEDILWSKENMSTVLTNDKRIFLANLNQLLIIVEYNKLDSGTYRIDIRQHISEHQYDIVETAFIELSVVGKYTCM